MSSFPDYLAKSFFHQKKKKRHHSAVGNIGPKSPLIQTLFSYLQSETGGHEPGDFATDVDGDFGGWGPLLDAWGDAGELATVVALRGGQTPERPLRHENPPEPPASVFEVDAQVREGGQGQESERGFLTQFHPLMFPEIGQDVGRCRTSWLKSC